MLTRREQQRRAHRLVKSAKNARRLGKIDAAERMESRALGIFRASMARCAA